MNSQPNGSWMNQLACLMLRYKYFWNLVNESKLLQLMFTRNMHLCIDMHKLLVPRYNRKRKSRPESTIYGYVLYKRQVKAKEQKPKLRNWDFNFDQWEG